MKKISVLITLSVAIILFFPSISQADVDCNSVTGAPRGVAGTIPVSFTFISLNDFTEEDRGNLIVFYEESVWELGGELTGFVTTFMSVIALEKNDTIVKGKTIGTGIEYQGLSGDISGTLTGHMKASTQGYEEIDILIGKGGLSGLTFKIYIPPQEESQTPSGDLIIWGCATVK